MRASVVVLAASLVAADAWAVTAESRGPVLNASVLVLPVEPKNGVTRDTADLASVLLIGRLRRVPNVRIVSYKEIEGAMTQAQRSMLVDCESISCVAEIAGALNADQIVLGTLGKLGSAYILSLSRIQSRNAKLVSSTVRQFPGATEDAITQEIPQAAAELFPEARELVLDAPRPEPPAAGTAGRTGGEQRIIIEQREPRDSLTAGSLTGVVLRTVGGFGAAGSLLVWLAAALGGATSVVALSWYIYRFYIPAVTNPSTTAARSAEENQFLFTLGALGSLGLVVALVVGAMATLLGLLNVVLMVLGVVLGRLGG